MSDEPHKGSHQALILLLMGPRRSILLRAFASAVALVAEAYKVDSYRRKLNDQVLSFLFILPVPFIVVMGPGVLGIIEAFSS